MRKDISSIVILSYILFSLLIYLLSNVLFYLIYLLSYVLYYLLIYLLSYILLYLIIYIFDPIIFRSLRCPLPLPAMGSTRCPRVFRRSPSTPRSESCGSTGVAVRTARRRPAFRPDALWGRGGKQWQGCLPPLTRPRHARMMRWTASLPARPVPFAGTFPLSTWFTSARAGRMH